MLANIVFIFTLSPLCAAEVMVKFDDLARMVSEHNQHVKGAKLKQRSAEEAKGSYGRSFLPRISVNGGSESFKTGTQEQRSEPFGAVEAKINLFNGGRDRLEGEVVDAHAKTAGMEADEEIRSEIKKARRDFWNLISLREQIKLLEEAKNENQRNQKAALSRIRAGIATETDRIEFDMHQIALDQDLARLELAATNTERNLAILLGLDEGVSIVTDKTVQHDHNDTLLSSTYRAEEHPVVAILELRADEARLEKSRFRRWWMPSVDVYGGYGLHTFREREYEPQDERKETVLGLKLSLELFDGLAGRTHAVQKSLLAEGLSHEAQQEARELKASFEASKAELKLTHELIHQSEDALKRANAYLARTLDEYRRGVKNSPDVLSASERNLQMKRRFAELRRDYQLARVELLSVLGK